MANNKSLDVVVKKIDEVMQKKPLKVIIEVAESGTKCDIFYEPPKKIEQVEGLTNHLDVDKLLGYINTKIPNYLSSVTKFSDGNGYITLIPKR